jgi:uncharacterized protein
VKIQVKVSPRSSVQKVIKMSDGSLKIHLKVSPTDGKANKELCKVIAEYYSLKKSQVSIKIGLASRNKIIEIAK